MEIAGPPGSVFVVVGSQLQSLWQAAVSGSRTIAVANTRSRFRPILLISAEVWLPSVLKAVFDAVEFMIEYPIIKLTGL